jgi:glutamate decarboxylase
LTLHVTVNNTAELLVNPAGFQLYPRPPAARMTFAAVRECCGRTPRTSAADRIGSMDPFQLLIDGRQLPVFAFTIADPDSAYSVFDVSAALRERGWPVPAYTFPANRQDLSVLRFVVRNGFSHDLADLLIDDLTVRYQC